MIKLRKVSAILLTLAMLLSMFPNMVFASEGAVTQAAEPTAADTVLFAQYNVAAVFEAAATPPSISVNGVRMGATWDKDYLYLVYTGNVEAPAITAGDATLSVITVPGETTTTFKISMADWGVELVDGPQYFDLTVGGQAIKVALVNEGVKLGSELGYTAPNIGWLVGGDNTNAAIDGDVLTFSGSGYVMGVGSNTAPVAALESAGGTSVIEFDYQATTMTKYTSNAATSAGYGAGAVFNVENDIGGELRFVLEREDGSDLLTLYSNPDGTTPATKVDLGAWDALYHFRVEYSHETKETATVKYYVNGKLVLTDDGGDLGLDPDAWISVAHHAQHAKTLCIYTCGNPSAPHFTVSNVTIGKVGSGDFEEELFPADGDYLFATYREDAAALAASNAAYIAVGDGNVGAIYDDTYLYLNYTGAAAPAVTVAGSAAATEAVEGVNVVKIPLASIPVAEVGNRKLVPMTVGTWSGSLSMANENAVEWSEHGFSEYVNSYYIPVLAAVEGKTVTFDGTTNKQMVRMFGDKTNPVANLASGGNSVVEFDLNAQAMSSYMAVGDWTASAGAIQMYIVNEKKEPLRFYFFQDAADKSIVLVSNPKAMSFVGSTETYTANATDMEGKQTYVDLGIGLNTTFRMRVEFTHAEGTTPASAKYYVDGRLVLVDNDVTPDAAVWDFDQAVNQTQCFAAVITKPGVTQKFTLSNVTIGKEVEVIKHTNVVLQLGADESQLNFTWFSKSDAAGTVAYAKAEDLVDGELPADATKVTATRTDSKKEGFYGNKATITGLLPGTTYAYQIVNGADKTVVKQFTTAASSSTFSFAFGGDPQVGHSIPVDKAEALAKIEADGEGFGKTLSQMMNSTEFNGINFFMSAGDQTNNIVQDENGWDVYNEYELREAMWDAYNNHDEFLSLPQVTVLGNHDAFPGALYPFHVNEPNMLTKEDGSYYGATYDGYGGYLQSADYYFTYGNVLFMVLNTNTFVAKNASEEATAADLASAQEHAAFIDRVMEETSDLDIDWTIVLYHQSPYGSSYHNNATTNENGDYNRTEQYAYTNIRKFLVPKLYEVGVDLVLSGHDHCYTRTHILKPATDEDGNYIDASVIDDEFYEYAEGTTNPIKVTDPDGILHITAATSSGSQVNAVEHTTEYTAVTATANTRHLSRIDISETELTIVTYNMGTDTTDAITEVDRFTISRPNHVAGEVEVENNVPADCTNPGSYDNVVYCTDCGKEMSRETIIVEATNHANKYDVEGSAPTCTETGLTDGVYCPDCETWLTVQEIIPATNHAGAASGEYQAPTCTVPGHSAGVYCPDCETWIAPQETIPATNHADKYDVEGSAPTCTETGLTDGVYCPDCETWLTEQETIPATNHANAYEGEANEPTCTEPGNTAGSYCPDCETWLTEQETIPATNHADKYDVEGSAPTCTETGLTDGVYCPDCDTWLTEQETIPATNHADKYDVEGSAPTCTETGLTDGVYCPDCETWLTEQETIPATNHANKYDVEANAPTCTETGLTDGVYCPDCETWLTKQETIPATNHANKQDVEANAPTCTETGLTDGVYCPDCETWLTKQETIPATNHANKYDVEGSAPTCTETGLTDGVYCPDCETWLTKQEIIPATNHAGAASGDYQAPTCTEPGHSAGAYCPDCDTWLDAQETIPATNHANKYDVEGNAPTCTETGLTDGVYCPDCDTWLTEQETIPATNHEDAYEVDAQAPTCNAVGYTAGTYCPDCETWIEGHEEVEALNHKNAYAGEANDPTCTEPGNTAGTYCPDCETWIVPQETIPASHDWAKTDCTVPTTCTVCGETQDDVGEHVFGFDNEENPEYILCVNDNCNAPLRKKVIKIGNDFYLTSWSGKIQKDYSCYLTDPHEDLAAGKHYFEFDAEGKMILNGGVGHNYKAVVTAPTCTEEGYTTYTCSGCGDSYVDNNVDALDHTWVDANCTAPKTCTNCGETEGVALTHVYSIDGDYITCERCEAPLRKQMIELYDEVEGKSFTYLTAWSGKIQKNYCCYWNEEYCEFDSEGRLIIVVIDESKTGIYNENGVDYFYRNGLRVRRELIEWEGEYYLTSYSGAIQKNHACYKIIGTVKTYCEFDAETGALTNIELPSGVGMKY